MRLSNRPCDKTCTHKKYCNLLICIILIILLLFPIVLHERISFNLSVTPDFWTILGTLATTGSTVLALFLAYKSFTKEKTEPARLVSSWVTTTYSPSADGESYHKSTILHIANQGEEPVFDVDINISVGYSRHFVGPLSVPHPLSVIPPRGELVFDLSTPLLGLVDDHDPKSTMTFTDARGKRWRRNNDGTITDSVLQGRWVTGPETSDLLDIPAGRNALYSPIAVAEYFLAYLLQISTENDDSILKSICSYIYPTSPIDSTEYIIELSKRYSHYAFTSMADFPTPYVAYVKITGDPQLVGKMVSGDGKLIEVSIITLVFSRKNGWGIYSIGKPVDPGKITFLPNTTNHQV